MVFCKDRDRHWIEHERPFKVSINKEKEETESTKINFDFREKYNRTIDVISNEYGFSSITGHPIFGKWDTKKITPKAIFDIAYQAFLAGANAVIECKESDPKGIEVELKNLQDKYKK